MEALAAISEGIDPCDHTHWQAAVRAHIHRRTTTVSAHVTERPGVLRPLRASQIVAKHVSRDTTVVADGALTYLGLSEVIPETRAEALVFHSHFSSMGRGFGLAVRAQARVDPGERVILVTGTGLGGDAPFPADCSRTQPATGTRLANGRSEAAAAAFGAGSYYANDAESLRGAVADALSRNAPACINVLIDLAPIPPEELVVMGMDSFAPALHSIVRCKMTAPRIEREGNLRSLWRLLPRWTKIGESG